MWRMGGGVPPKKWDHPHEPGLFVPKGGTVLGNLKAHTRAMQSSCCAGLDRLSLPWCARWRVKGQGQRLLQGWPLYPRGSSGASLSLEARSRIEEDAARIVERRAPTLRWRVSSPILAPTSTRGSLMSGVRGARAASPKASQSGSTRSRVFPIERPPARGYTRHDCIAANRQPSPDALSQH